MCLSFQKLLQIVLLRGATQAIGTSTSQVGVNTFPVPTSEAISPLRPLSVQFPFFGECPVAPCPSGGLLFFKAKLNPSTQTEFRTGALSMLPENLFTANIILHIGSSLLIHLCPPSATENPGCITHFCSPLAPGIGAQTKPKPHIAQPQKPAADGIASLRLGGPIILDLQMVCGFWPFKLLSI